MTKPTDSNTAETAAINYEEKLHDFWRKNRGAIYAVCAVVVLAITAKGGWELYTSQREKNLEHAYALATTAEELHDFAHNYQGEKLAGAAYLRLADEEYSDGKYTEAIADYGQAADALKGTPFASRAQLGQAMGTIQAGHADDGEAQLRQIASDLSQLAAVRAEAAYDLASIAADEGRTDEAKEFIAQVEQIDASGAWAQRALDLQGNFPAEAGTNGAVAPVPSVNLPGPAK